MKKTLTEPEFKKRCKEKGIRYSVYLWNRYMDRVWREIERELLVIKRV